MAETLGLRLLAGWQREATVYATTWPAASAAALAALLPLLDLQGNDGVQKAGHADVRSGQGLLAFDVLQQAPTATLPLRLTYQGFEALWACALGHMAGRLGGVRMPEVLTTGAYRHLYEVDPRLSTVQGWQAGDGWLAGDGLIAGQRKVRRGTLAVDYQVSVWQWLSTMIQGLTLQCTPQRVSLTVDLVGHSLSRASVLNTSATMAILPLPTAPHVLYTDLVWRIAPYSAVTPLGGGDAIGVSSWTLRLENHLTTSYGARTGTAPEEYERSTAPTVTLTMVLPRHSVDIWQTRWGANTILMADAKFTGPLLGVTGRNYQCNLYFLSLSVTNAQLETAGVRVPPDTVQLQAIVPSAAAAGFPPMQTLSPLAVELVSGVSTHPLL